MSKKRKKEKINYKEIQINLKRSWQYMKPHRSKIVFYILVSLGLTGLGVITPLISAKILLNITNGLFGKLILAAATLFFVQCVTNVLSYLSSRISNLIYLDSLLSIQIDIAGEILNLEEKELDNNSSGVFVERLKGDSNSLARIFSNIADTSIDLLGNIGVLVAVFIINKFIFVYFIIEIVVLWILEKIRIKKYFKIDTKYRKINEKNTGLANELVRGIRDIKVLNIKTSFLDKVSGSLKDIFNERFEMQKVSRLYELLINNISDFFEFTFIIVGVLLIAKSNLTIDNFVILYMYRNRVSGLIGYFAYMLNSLKDFNLSAKRIFEILDNDKYKKEKFGNKKLAVVKGDFEFKNVNFAYKRKQQVIKNMNFKIKANETVAFVGKSGVGKTTVFALLDKLYNVNSGSILIDGININELDQSSIRDSISIITQSPYIFNFTIKENLKLLKPNATDKEIEEVCKIACLDEFIEGLPKKYNTLIGENGVTLSGGQKQRLAIARALLRKTEIILFDEATSSLDNETQYLIQKAIANMQGEYTILIVAHRLSTIINADRILVVDDGKIVDEGNHQTLMSKSKLYKDLYETELK